MKLNPFAGLDERTGDHGDWGRKEKGLVYDSNVYFVVYRRYH